MSLLRPMLDHSLHWITLSLPEVKVLIGILPHERVEPQNIKVELALGFPDLYPSGTTSKSSPSEYSTRLRTWTACKSAPIPFFPA